MNFEKRLIQLVRQNDILYNYYHPDYNNHPRRSVIWTGIARQLDIDAKEAQKRWQNLRRVFRRIRIKIHETGRLPRSKWRHYDDMEFIKEFDPTPSEQNVLDIKKGLRTEQNEQILADDIKFEDFDGLSSTNNCADHHVDNSEILHSISIEHLPEHEAENSIVFEEIINPATPSKARKKHMRNLTPTCSQNLAILGAKVDAVRMPQRLIFELERKVSDLVYEVLNKYSTEV